MKKVLCVLCVMFVLLMGGASVFADPHAEPDTQCISLEIIDVSK